MTTESLEQLEEILYDGLCSLDDPQERREFLDQTCRGNPGLRARLEQLMSLRDEADRFFGFTPQADSTMFELGGLDPQRALDSECKEGLGTRIGRYRLLERLGEGGCGAVYLAEQFEPVRRRVALKIIRVGMHTESIIARFEMERQALALMDHPNIARVLDAGATASGRPFFVMQMVEGLRITDFCDHNHLDLRGRLRLFIPVCLAIQHAHQKGIIHCDIKPSNVMITLHDGVAVPKVIDFGIARAAESGTFELPSTASSSFVGTPAYMSPEQVNGNGMDIDTRSDIYSLGALLYELLTGAPPHDPQQFKQAGPEEIRSLLRNAQLMKPSDRLRADLPPRQNDFAEVRGMAPARFSRMLEGDLDAIIQKAMAHDRQQRYGTASGLAADVVRFLDNEPVIARPAGRGYRLAKLVRRNRVVFAVGVMMVFALGGGFGTSTWLFYREKQARQEQARLRESAELARAREVRLREKAQAATAVAHAAVLISHADLAQADKVLAEVEFDNIPASLESATAFRAVGEWLLREGRWAEASKRFAAVAQSIARADKSDSESISIHFVAAAAALAGAGDLAHYDELRNMATDRFSTSTDPIVADEVVKSCLIKTAPPELLAKIAPLVKVMDAHLPWDRDDAASEGMEAWQMISLALASYRERHYEAAEAWCRRCLRHPNVNRSRNSAARAILSMVLTRTGHTDQADPELEMAKSEVAFYFKEPFQIEYLWTDQGFWFDWMIARLLVQEAESTAS